MSSQACWVVVRGRVLGISKQEVTPPLAQAQLAVNKSSLCSQPGLQKCTCGSMTPGNKVNPCTSISQTGVVGPISRATQRFGARASAHDMSLTGF